jgi:DNA-binding NarL/FixJ family response regulator
MTRVLVVDDSFVMRAGLRSFVTAIGGFDVVGDASGGIDALRAARELHPDIVLMDLRMAEGDGIAATRAIANELPTARTIVMTWLEDPQAIRDVVSAGAKGVLVHGHYSSRQFIDILRALAEACAPEAPILHVPFSFGIDGARAEALDALTSREREILELLRQGFVNRAIGAELRISEKTVKNHINSIYSKLNVRSRLEAMAAPGSGGVSGM